MGVLIVDSIGDLVLVLNSVPNRNVILFYELSSLGPVHSLRCRSQRLDDASQPLSYRRSQLHRCLLHIDLPGPIQGVRHVDADSGQLRELRSPRQSKPGAMDDQPPLPVHVEALVLDIALQSSIAFPLRGRDLPVVRKGERLHQNVLICDSNPFFGARNRRRMPGMEWIKGLQGPVVHLYAHTTASRFTGEVAVEHQLQVGPGLIHLSHKVGHIPTGISVVRPETELFPDNERPARTEMFSPRDGCQVVGYLDLPPARLGNVVEIPPGTRGRSICSGHDREYPALGEGGHLQAEAEAAKIGLRPLLQRAAAPQSHCLQEFVLGQPHLTGQNQELL